MASYYKFFLGLTLSLIISICSTSCVNDGDIGDLYGKWQITDITTADSTATPTDLFLSFQSNVVVAQIVFSDDHYARDLHGVYQHRGDSLVIQFLPMDSIGQTMREGICGRFLMGDDYSNVRMHVGQLDRSTFRLDMGANSWKLRKY